MSAPVLPRLRRPLVRARERLATQRRLFEETQRLLVEHAAWLEPGDWTPVGPKLKVWHHTEAPLPHAVVADGGKAGKKPKSAANGASPSQRVKKGILAGARRVQRLRQPTATTVPPVEPSRGNATAVVKANGNRADFVALEPEAGRALRLARPGTYDHEYVEVRRRFQQHLPAPGFSVSDDGAVLVEDWADGQVLKGLAAQRQVAVAVEVLDRYGDLVATERAADEGTVWQALPRLLDQVAVPAVLREPLADPRVRLLLTSGMLSPGQGDLSAKNITADGQGSWWQVVDFDGTGWLPVWWDPIGLVGSMPRYAGELDGEQHRVLTAALDRVWAAAGLDDAAGLTPQHWAALESVRKPWEKGAQTSHSTVAGGYIEPDPDDFAWHLHQQARKVEAQLARR